MKNPFSHLAEPLDPVQPGKKFFNLNKLEDSRYVRLPFSIRVLLEAAVRNCDEFLVKKNDIENILHWNIMQHKNIEVPFKPARVILQDFTGVPAVVDFAAMRDAVKKLGGDPEKINPVCPADLVIDHSIQMNTWGWVWWHTVIPVAQEAETGGWKVQSQPQQKQGFFYPLEFYSFLSPSKFHTWLSVPLHVGFHSIYPFPPICFSSVFWDILSCPHLRQVGVVATIANMCPEYGATAAFFPVDEISIKYLVQTGWDENKVKHIKKYLQAVGMFRDFSDCSQDPDFTQVVALDLKTVVPCCSGPKRPQDKVAVSDMKKDFETCLGAKQGFKGFQVPADHHNDQKTFIYNNNEFTLAHGSVVIAAITSCTNTSNPSVMLGAGLLAKKAVDAGLNVKPYIKTSLSPGSGVVTYYLRESGVMPYLSQLGFDVVGYGCMTCIGNSGPLPEPVVEAIIQGDLVAVGVLSGNRNFEGRVHPNTRANYLASPPLVIAYAIAGTIRIDFEKEPLGTNAKGQRVFLKDIWPTRDEIQAVERQYVIPGMFKEVYQKIETVNESWNALGAPSDKLYFWNPKSTYIKSPPFFENLTLDLQPPKSIVDAYVLLNLGDSVTTDHISPAGNIARNSPAARYLTNRGLTPRDFNSYGSRRGNDAIMAWGTFANIRLLNKFLNKQAPQTIHLPSGETLDVFDAAERYQQAGLPLIVLAGKEYGSGSSRDWAAKGPFLLGIKAVLAESYERIHRSNLVGMGVIPLEYLPGENADTLGLTGRERYTIVIPENLKPQMKVQVKLDTGKTFQAVMRFDTDVELTYFHNGGILNYMIRKMAREALVS
uniref:Aconitase 1 n=1 Tax=Spermophilus dauricus TaxID=99837 RepID=A0A8C9P1E1_SPEDA